MDPITKERLQTAALYLLFLLVYVIIAGLLGTFAGIIFGSTIDHVLTGTVVGGLIGLGLGAIVAVVGRALIPPAEATTTPTGETPAEADSPRADTALDGPAAPSGSVPADRVGQSPEAPEAAPGSSNPT